MIPTEFAPIAALIDNCCKDDFDDGREAAYALVLSSYAAVDVRQAVVNLLGRPGPAWVPSSQEIAAEVHAVRFVGTPEWARRRFSAVVHSLPDELSGRFWEQAHDGVFDLDLIAEHVLAIHDTYGKQLLRALRQLRHVRVSALANVSTLWVAGADAHRAWTEAGFVLAAAHAPRQVGEGTPR